MSRIKIAPDVEFKMDIDLEEITETTRDYNVQQHKPEIYAEFEKRLKGVFPEGFRIDSFEFGLDTEQD